jgi:multiple sugar transport system ATP-binding protein
VLELDIEIPRRHFQVAVAFTVAPGERFALFGPSGAGKTTVLEAVAGLIRPRHGTISLAGRVLWAGAVGCRPRHQVPFWERAVALLRQRPGLFPHLTVRENLTYSRRLADPGDLARLVDLLDLDGLLDARPGRLSGGQAHRVALARALASDCRALLLDEPYTGLDATLRRQVTTLVREEVSRREIPAVLVAHELTEAQAFADTLGVIDEGRLLQVGTPHEVVLHPASRRVAELVGYQGFVALNGAIVAVHPERVRLGAHPDLGPVLTGYLERARPAGTGFEADLRIADTEVTCRLPSDVGPPGTTLEITVVEPPLFDHAERSLSRPQVVRA